MGTTLLAIVNFIKKAFATIFVRKKDCCK